MERDLAGRGCAIIGGDFLSLSPFRRSDGGTTFDGAE